jgi:hypothetical protein
MKRWRTVEFASVEEVERYLNGLSIEPDQIKGIFAQPSTGEGCGVVLVCWLSAHQQRIEQLRHTPRPDDDLASTQESTSNGEPAPEKRQSSSRGSSRGERRAGGRRTEAKDDHDS